ncbi:transcriptional initiation protein Tat [Haloferax larsenii]|uniref:Transcriptional initiation protein Tat n=1 Tax=Haloferax larsenii TaxID=302484 RepID=A0ABY5RCF2_HALLR|nr:transcriptional initiation protein Tat [Haloferax larsenii]UVE50041.1 transcriptional initiation protein Tat [Haloferax larsenii]
MSPDDTPSPSNDSPSPDDTSVLHSRRQFLGLLGGGSAVFAGVGWFAPTWLPDVVTDQFVIHYPEPPAHVWRPEVSETHADEAVARLEQTVERAQTLKERVDSDSVPRRLEFHLRQGDPTGGWLELAKSASDTHERLSNATTGMMFAGETVGAAKAVLDEVDPEALAERGTRIQSRAEDVLDSFSDYAVSDPTRDLAYLYFVEESLASARTQSRHWERVVGEGERESDYPDDAVVDTYASYLQAEQHLEDARYYRDLYRENLGEQTEPYADALATSLKTLIQSIAALPTHVEMRERVEDERDLGQRTPYGAARWELLSICFDDQYQFNYGADGHRHGHTVQRLVETANALLGRRAHEFALDALDVDPDDTDYDSGRTFRAKRRAVRQFRSVRKTYDSPFAGILAQYASKLIHAAELGIHMADRMFPMWRNRVEATTYYLASEGQMHAFDEVFQTIFDDS